MRTTVIAVVGSLIAAALVLIGSVEGSLRYFVLPLQFLVVFSLLIASSVRGRAG